EVGVRGAPVHGGAARALVVAGPVDEWANATAIGRAFACAASRRGRILCVGTSSAWREAVASAGTGWDGREVEEGALGETLVRLRERPESLDVIVTEAHLVDAIVDTAAAFAGSQASLAEAWLPDQ